MSQVQDKSTEFPWVAIFFCETYSASDGKLSGLPTVLTEVSVEKKIPVIIVRPNAIWIVE